MVHVSSPAMNVVSLRGWAERQKVMGCLMEGMFMEVGLVPQNTGGGEL